MNRFFDVKLWTLSYFTICYSSPAGFYWMGKAKLSLRRWAELLSPFLFLGRKLLAPFVVVKQRDRWSAITEVDCTPLVVRGSRCRRYRFIRLITKITVHSLATFTNTKRKLYLCLLLLKVCSVFKLKYLKSSAKTEQVIRIEDKTYSIFYFTSLHRHITALLEIRIKHCRKLNQACSLIEKRHK